MPNPSPDLSAIGDLERNPERSLQFEFVRATENAALACLPWLGRDAKETADDAASRAILGVLEYVDICGECVIGEGIKDNAPGIFIGDKLGTWAPGSWHVDVAVDPIDGTTNLSKGMPNSISVMAATFAPPGAPRAMMSLPSFYAEKLTYGPRVVEQMELRRVPAFNLDTPLTNILDIVALALGKRVREIVVCTMDRPRHAKLIEEIRASGAALRLISDGDITAAVAPALHDAAVDLYFGIGGSPEGVLTAAALRALGGDIQLRMWPRDAAERADLLKAGVTEAQLKKIYRADELVTGDSVIFCATGISDSPLLPGVRVTGHRAITHSILMRAKSRSVRRIETVHDLRHKTIRLRGDSRERTV